MSTTVRLSASSRPAQSPGVYGQPGRGSGDWSAPPRRAVAWR